MGTGTSPSDKTGASDKTGRAHVMHFYGVRTGGSSALRLFPQWAEVLGLEGARLVGVDLPLDASPEQYRAAVRRLRDDPSAAGALVTTHKLNVVRDAGDLIDGLTDDARLCGEVSALYKRGGQLWGHACDPTTSGTAMDHFLGADYWARHPEAGLLMLGAGGAAVAMVVHLLTRAAYRPATVMLVDKDAGRLRHLQRLIDRFPEAGQGFKLVHHADAAANDALMAVLPPHSMVVNATGMGKDLPGSPITDAALFPESGVAWELNYRGARRFLTQARQQQASRGLIVEDGWHYFLLGWSTVIGYVYDITISGDRFQRFAAVSEQIRSAT